MFSGIVRTVGTVDSLMRIGRSGAELAVKVYGTNPFPELECGESIAVNGACLTVAAIKGEVLHLDLMAPTLEKTNLGCLNPGDLVNLEPALRVGDPLGGHFVSGHIDGTSEIREIRKEGETTYLDLTAGGQLLDGLIPQGSVAIDGVSLTVASLEPEGFTVGLIPFTLARTTLSFKKAGEVLNIELDMIGKYLRQFAARQSSGTSPITPEFLKEHGFLT
ncbi:MAG: riboflavin synthase [Candidatus Omnitrophica bacterium]|nr:riboflavin synthase [Candidatus Omnitrophota bacterium]